MMHWGLGRDNFLFSRWGGEGLRSFTERSWATVINSLIPTSAYLSPVLVSPLTTGHLGSVPHI